MRKAVDLEGLLRPPLTIPQASAGRAPPHPHPRPRHTATTAARMRHQSALLAQIYSKRKCFTVLGPFFLGGGGGVRWEATYHKPGKARHPPAQLTHRGTPRERGRGAQTYQYILGVGGGFVRRQKPNGLTALIPPMRGISAELRVEQGVIAGSHSLR